MGSTGELDHATLNDSLVCKSCLSHYNSVSKHPKLLPCSHTFCQDCVVRYFYKTKKNHNSVYCPLCDKKHDLKLQTAEEIPKNFEVMDMLLIRSPEQHEERQSTLLKEHDDIWGGDSQKEMISKFQQQPLHPPINFHPPDASAFTPSPESDALINSISNFNDHVISASKDGGTSLPASKSGSLGSPTLPVSADGGFPVFPTGSVRGVVMDVRSTTITGSPFLVNGFLQNAHEGNTSPLAGSYGQQSSVAGNHAATPGMFAQGGNTALPEYASKSGSVSSPEAEEDLDWNYFSAKSTIGRNDSSARPTTQGSILPNAVPSPNQYQQLPQQMQHQQQPIAQQSQQPIAQQILQLQPAAPVFSQGATLKINFSPSDKMAITERGKLVVNIFGKDGKVASSFPASNGRDSCFLNDKTFAIAVNEGVELYDVETGKFISMIPVKKPVAVAAVKNGFVTTIGSNLSMCLFMNGKIAPFSVACAKNADGSLHFFKGVRDLATTRNNADLIVVLDESGIVFTSYAGNVVSFFPNEYLKSVGVNKVECINLSSLGNILLLLDPTTNTVHAFEITQSPPRHMVLNLDTQMKQISSFAINSLNQIFVVINDTTGPTIKMFPLGGQPVLPSPPAFPIIPSKTALTQHSTCDYTKHHDSMDIKAKYGSSGNGDEDLRDKLKEQTAQKEQVGTSPEVYVEAQHVGHFEASAVKPKLHYVETLRIDLKMAEKVKMAPQNKYMVIDKSGKSVRVVSEDGKTTKAYQNDEIIDACIVKDEVVVAKTNAIDFHSVESGDVLKEFPIENPVCVSSFKDGFVTTDGKKVIICVKDSERVEVNIIGRVTTDSGKALVFKQIKDISTTPARPDSIAVLGPGGIVIINSGAKVESTFFQDQLTQAGLTHPVKISFSFDGEQIFVMDISKRIFLMDVVPEKDGETSPLIYLPLDNPNEDVKTFFVNEENQVCLVCKEGAEHVIKVYDMDSLFI